MLYSSSSPTKKQSGDPYFYVKRQAVWLVVGMVGCIAAARTDYHKLDKYKWWIFGAGVVLLGLCFVPGIGVSINGSRRWLRILGFTVQPSEFAKLSIVVFLAYWLHRNQLKMANWKIGMLYPLAIISVPLILILMERDLGATALIGAVALCLLFIGGSSPRSLMPVAVAGFGGLLTLAILMPNRLKRLFAFLDPEGHKSDAGYQVWQGLIAIGSGGLEGLGLGNSRQKWSYLPEPHTDFIFPVIGEELGLRVTLIIVVAYIVLLMCGTMITICSRDRFGMILGAGIVLLISLQAMINIGVVTAMLPNKGMPLPFISYGGSNMVMNFIGIGILMNIFRQGIYVTTHDPFSVADFTPKI